MCATQFSLRICFLLCSLSSFPSCVCNSNDRWAVAWAIRGSLSVPICIQVCECSLQYSMYLNLQHRTTCVCPLYTSLPLTCGRVRKIAKSGCVSLVMSVFSSVLPHWTNWLPLDGCSWNLIFCYFSKTRRENLIFVKICQEWWVLYMKTRVILWWYY